MMMGIGFSEILALLLLLGGAIGLPVGIPPAKEDPLLAKIAPAECLFYTSWAGLAEADPKSKNHTEQLLAETEVREFLADLERRIGAAARTFAERERSPGARLMADMLPKWGKAVLTKPTAVYLADLTLKPGAAPQVHAGIMMNAGDDVAELKALLERLQADAIRTPIKTVTIAGALCYQFQPAPDAPQVTWGVKGKYIVAGLGEGAVESLFERAKGEAPQWLTDVRKSLPVERPATVAFVDVKKLSAIAGPLAGPQGPAAIEAFGLGNVTTYSSVTGLDQTGFVSRSLLALDGEPTGMLAIWNAKPLAAADLSVIPHDAPVAVSLRLSAATLLEAAIKSASKLEPRAADLAEDGLKGLEGALEVKVREDIVDSLGDTWLVYAAPDAGGLVTGWTATVTVKDRDRLNLAHEKLLRLAQESFGDHPRAPRIAQFKFAGQEVYYFTVPDDDMPFTPAWCLTDDRLVVALYPQAIKAHLTQEKREKSLADVPEVASMLAGPAGPQFLTYFDPKEVLRLAYPFLQIAAQFGLAEMRREGIDLDISVLPSLTALNKHLRPGVSVLRRTKSGLEFETRQTLPGGNVGATAPVLAALLLPAVSSAREAAMRSQGANNLKQIGLSLHNYHDVYRRFPSAYNTDKDGKPLLSWRVHVLPFIEQQPLYDQFHFDEPWDSEHNKKLIAKMPPTYAAPGSKNEPGKTNYLAIRTKAGVLVPPEEADKGKKQALGLGMASITDGTSNTIMVVEASDAKAVIWTKPDDFVPDEMAPARGLVGLRMAGFQALFCDGSVRFISEKVDVRMLMNLFSRNDGNVVNVP